eukprot:8293520-Pyramimonas_sp.AAC.1
MMKGKQRDYDMYDWAPVAWHVKGFSLLVMSIHLDANSSLQEGVNSGKLSSLAAFVRATDLPRLICGDVNHAPEAFWRSGWARAMGAEAAVP